MWVKGLSERCDVTVLTSHRAGWDVARSPTDAREVVNWTHFSLKGRWAQIDYQLKPHYLLFYFRARRWLKERIRQGFDFDIVHQLNPVSIRYPSPARGLGLKYVTGPHAGSLSTPPGFESESPEKQWFRKLRGLDLWRVKHDPFLRESFGGAAVVLGVAPYVAEFLAPANLQRFEIMAETGPELVIGEQKGPVPEDRPLRLLFVGRIVRTKGVLDAIRAVAIAAKTCNITFDILGQGELLQQCKDEVERLGVDGIVTFHGRLPRNQVYEWYARSDVFLFPSFREPSGTVVFEAMGFGLPLITTTVGGPAHVVTPECGELVEPIDPVQFAGQLAHAICGLSANRQRIPAMSAAALARVQEVASWDSRFDRLLRIYQQLGSSRHCPSMVAGGFPEMS
jgi:glycosyltransferase involved in cell wall biosynthesis